MLELYSAERQEVASSVGRRRLSKMHEAIRLRYDVDDDDDEAC